VGPESQLLLCFCSWWAFLTVWFICLSAAAAVVTVCCCCQVNKEDLLSMVRYGAELVFSSEASNITGEQKCK
jgi:hypothetical protein